MSKQKMRDAAASLRQEAELVAGAMADFLNDDIAALPTTWSLESALDDYNAARKEYFRQRDEQRRTVTS